ncbi:MAG: NAD(P)H-hydrate dehydratase [Bacteroidales bacterium]|nr:NAD(P)H-hydrate dehydratase [Bacteroidales bacterium]
MKILPIDKIREADAYTIKHEPIADIDLMERAARELCDWVSANILKEHPILIYCGLGNNGGDGFALGRMLAELGYSIEIRALRYSEKMSPSCAINYERAKKIKKIRITEIGPDDKLPEIPQTFVVVDAIFGSGLTRPIKGFMANIVRQINNSENIVVAIDAPSGFFCDQSNSVNDGEIIQADYTLTFQFPKFGFLFPENDRYVGHWEVLFIGLHPDFIRQVEIKDHYLLTADCRPLIKTRNKFSHKGTYGHGLLIAGGYGKMGAAVLAAKAGLKAGAGLITAHIPSSGNVIMQTAVPMAMVSMDEDEFYFSKHPDLSAYNAIAVGPGLGTDKKSQGALKLLIQNTKLPMVFDADAINILGENKTWIPFVPKNSIFTPHPKEFERLVGKSSNDFDRNEKQKEFARKHGVYVILKGAHTSIACPDGTCYFNSTGNPGMATGGSGDVLTGMLLGILAQGYHPKEACILGVFLHGMAGDYAASKWGYEALTADNITDMIGKAFQKLTHQKKGENP